MNTKIGILLHSCPNKFVQRFATIMVPPHLGLVSTVSRGWPEHLAHPFYTQDWYHKLIRDQYYSQKSDTDRAEVKIKWLSNKPDIMSVLAQLEYYMLKYSIYT